MKIISQLFIAKNRRYLHLPYILFYFALLLVWSLKQPFNSVPDEEMRFAIPNYIFSHGELANGYDPSIVSFYYGFSYAGQPQLPYIISAVFMKLIQPFAGSFFTLVMAARMTSILSGVVNLIFVYKISGYLFKDMIHRYIAVTLITLWPQYLFVFTYVNCDGLALLSVSVMLYALLDGFKNDWNYRNSFVLALGISIALLSYLNIYLLLPVCVLAYFLYFLSVSKQANKWQRFFKYGFFIFGVVLVLAGWQFVRNFIIYDGDIFGIGVFEKMSAKYSKFGYSFAASGAAARTNLIIFRSYIIWMKYILYSFTARFGNMNIIPNRFFNFVYLFETAIGIITFFIYRHSCKKSLQKSDRILFFVLFLFLLMPFVFTYYYSFFCDFQPQGRYAIAAVLPLGIFMTYGLSFLFERLKKHTALPLWIVCPVWSLICIFYSLSILQAHPKVPGL